MKENKVVNPYIWQLPFINIIIYLLIWGIITGYHLAMIGMVSVIILSRIFKIHSSLGDIAGRKLVMLSFTMTVAVMVFALWDKTIQAGQVMNFVLSCIPVCFFPLLFKDLWQKEKSSEEVDYYLPELRKPTPFSKKPQERPNLNSKRWYEMSFSYPLIFSAMNAVYPRAIYALSVWGALLYIIPNNYPKYVYILLVLSGIGSLIYFKNAKQRKFKEWFFYLLGGVIFALAMFALLSVFQNMLTKMNYNWMLKNVNNGWFNNTFSPTQIGKEDGDFNDGQALLMRVVWPNRNTTLLPASYFNLFIENNWSVSANFVSGKTLKVNNGTVELPDINDVPLLDLKSFNPITDHKNNRFNFSSPSVSLDYSERQIPSKEDADNRIVIIGQMLKNQRGLTALPIPTNSKYIIGENSKGTFSKYSNSSVVYAKNNSLVNWQIIYDKNKYLRLHNPLSYDLSYPKEYEEDLKNLKNEIGINNDDSPDEKALKIQLFFQNNYRYTLDLKNKDGEGRTLHDFMTVDRRGHCEYFASVTTLLMRYVGIPTRYTVGFLVSEKHNEEMSDMYWVRKKDAHAWATYWDGKGWSTVDTTPYSSEEWEKPWYFKMSNSFNHFQYLIDNLDVDSIKEFFSLDKIIIIASGFVLVIFMIRIKRKKTKKISDSKVEFIYVEGHEESILRNELKDVLEKFPKSLGEPWLRWAKRTGDEKVIKRIKEYYKKVY